MNSKLPMMIAVRGYAVPVRDKDTAKRQRAPLTQKKRKAFPKPSYWAVVFDTETTNDHRQNIRIGTYRVFKGLILHESGIFYEPANLMADEITLLQAHAQKRGLTLRTREEFVREILYRYGYDYGGLIIGFNLPFDLSRLAIGISTSHGKDMRGGFTLELLPEKWRPHILVRHLNSRAAFMRFATAPRASDARSARKKGIKTESRTGFFQDVKTIGAAILGGSQKLKLASLAKSLKTEHQKINVEEHGGPLTPEYIDYAINDTLVTWECYCALREQYAEHGLSETPPHRIYSEASLGKGYLREMGIERWNKLQRNFPPDLLGKIMCSFYGGRAEVRIRREIRRVLNLDFRSMYPSVFTLMGLWPFVIAEGVEWTEWTRETRMLLDYANLAEHQERSFWKFLTVLVQVEPDEDIFPVRARYGEQSRTIGLNYLSAKFGLWYTLADCFASKLLTGKFPKIIRAIRFTPKGRQEGLKPISIGGHGEYTIDPSADFFKRVIEMRGEIQAKEKKAKAKGKLHEAERLSSYEKMLKALAVSTSYGIYAELNVQSYDRPRDVICYGSECEFDPSTKSIEEPGTHFNPVIATLITGAARLMLAIAERVASDQGIGWMFCDTDSLALARPDGMDDEEFLRRAKNVTEWFKPLSPYDDDKPLFKVEDQNYRIENGEPVKGEHEPLYGLAISAKRYVLFNLDGNGHPAIRKALAHGLGHWRAPYPESAAPASIPMPVVKLSDIGVERWQYDVWYQIILATLEGHPDQVDLSVLPHLDRPAKSRYTATTPELLHWFDKFNRDKKFVDRVKAFNFMFAYQVSPTALNRAIALGEISDEFIDDGLPAVVAPYGDDPEKTLASCFDRHTGKPIPPEILATYLEAVADYHRHSESKFANAEGHDAGITERRHIQAIAVEYIGKEANRWEEQFYLGEIPEAQIVYGLSADGKKQILRVIGRAARKFGRGVLATKAALSRQQLSEALKRKATPRPRTLSALLQAVATLETERRERRAYEAALIERSRMEVSQTSLSETAERLSADPSNLAKVLSAQRRPSDQLLQRMETRFGAAR